MQNMAEVWTSLSPIRRIVLAGVTIAVFGLLVLIARGASERSMSLLFGGLEPAAAGEVVTALEQRGIAHEVRGAAIYVDSTQRDNMRMLLAADGLPANGTQGYELLDSLSGFSTTSQMFDAALWRAKEGELARTIQSSPAIRSARVHIATPTSRPFERSGAPSAAITITPAGSAAPGPDQVEALQFLVSAAVAGLDPADVAVIDDAGMLLSGAPAGLAERGADRADALRARAARVLTARVGPGNAVVEVTVDTVMESETRVERVLDPDSRIAISTDVTESTEKSTDSGQGAVTVASNLPDGDAAADSSSSNEGSETRSLTNFDVSETERQIVREAGDVRRLTVAVLVNDIENVAADGTVSFTPRTPEELASLEALVTSAVGFDADRGDVITLQSMPFEPVATPEGSTALVPGGGTLDVMRLIQLGVLAVVTLLLGLFVVRPILTGRHALNRIEQPALPVTAGTGAAAVEGAAVMDLPAPAAEGQPPALSHPDAVSRLRDMIASRETETVQILQDWIEDPDQTRGARS